MSPRRTALVAVSSGAAELEGELTDVASDLEAALDELEALRGRITLQSPPSVGHRPANHADARRVQSARAAPLIPPRGRMTGHAQTPIAGEEPVGIAQDVQVLAALLAEEVVDPEHLVLVEHR